MFCLEQTIESKEIKKDKTHFFKKNKTVSLHTYVISSIMPSTEVIIMANENTKDFNAMLQDSKDMPKIQTIKDARSIAKYGGDKMYMAPPIAYDKVMKRVPEGKLTTVGEIREFFASQSGADFTEPITAGVFVSIVAWASHQRGGIDETPYWRTLRANGELNMKYPGGVKRQKEKLEAEGHTIIERGRKNIRYYVKDYEQALCSLQEINTQ